MELPPSFLPFLLPPPVSSQSQKEGEDMSHEPGWKTGRIALSVFWKRSLDSRKPKKPNSTLTAQSQVWRLQAIPQGPGNPFLDNPEPSPTGTREAPGPCGEGTPGTLQGRQFSVNSSKLAPSIQTVWFWIQLCLYELGVPVKSFHFSVPVSPQ